MDNRATDEDAPVDSKEARGMDSPSEAKGPSESNLVPAMGHDRLQPRLRGPVLLAAILQSLPELRGVYALIGERTRNARCCNPCCNCADGDNGPCDE